MPDNNSPPCKHMNFAANVDVHRLTESETTDEAKRYQAEVRVYCSDCNLPFRFLGLPCGVDLNGAAVSIDGEQGRFAILPKGEVLTPLDDAACSGFTVRKTK